MNSLSKAALFSTLLALGAASSGCFLIGAAIAGGAAVGANAMAKSQAKKKLKEDMQKAPEVSNPVVADAVDDASVFGPDDTKWQMTSFDSNKICFNVVAHYAPSEMQSMTYRLQAWKSPEQDDETVPTMKGADVKVVDSTHEMKPVEKHRTEYVKDANGQTIGSVEKTDTVLEPYYTTSANVCFKNPTILTREAKYMVVHLVTPQTPEDMPLVYGVWKLKA